jgi:hypothetical protein
MLIEIIAFLSLYLLLVFTDLVPVYKGKGKKGIILCTGVFAVAFAFQILIICDVKIPRYADIMEGLLKIMTGHGW